MNSKPNECNHTLEGEHNTKVTQSSSISSSAHIADNTGQWSNLSFGLEDDVDDPDVAPGRHEMRSRFSQDYGTEFKTFFVRDTVDSPPRSGLSSPSNIHVEAHGYNETREFNERSSVLNTSQPHPMHPYERHSVSNVSPSRDPEGHNRHSGAVDGFESIPYYPEASRWKGDVEQSGMEEEYPEIREHGPVDDEVTMLEEVVVHEDVIRIVNDEYVEDHVAEENQKYEDNARQSAARAAYEPHSDHNWSAGNDWQSSRNDWACGGNDWQKIGNGWGAANDWDAYNAQEVQYSTNAGNYSNQDPQQDYSNSTHGSQQEYSTHYFQSGAVPEYVAEHRESAANAAHDHYLHNSDDDEQVDEVGVWKATDSQNARWSLVVTSYEEAVYIQNDQIGNDCWKETAGQFDGIGHPDEARGSAAYQAPNEWNEGQYYENKWRDDENWGESCHNDNEWIEGKDDNYETQNQEEAQHKSRETPNSGTQKRWSLLQEAAPYDQQELYDRAPFYNPGFAANGEYSYEEGQRNIAEIDQKPWTTLDADDASSRRADQQWTENRQQTQSETAEQLNEHSTEYEPYKGAFEVVRDGLASLFGLSKESSDMDNDVSNQSPNMGQGNSIDGNFNTMSDAAKRESYLEARKSQSEVPNSLAITLSNSTYKSILKQKNEQIDGSEETDEYLTNEANSPPIVEIRAQVSAYSSCDASSGNVVSSNVGVGIAATSGNSTTSGMSGVTTNARGVTTTGAVELYGGATDGTQQTSQRNKGYPSSTHSKQSNATSTHSKHSNSIKRGQKIKKKITRIEDDPQRKLAKLQFIAPVSPIDASKSSPFDYDYPSDEANLGYDPTPTSAELATQAWAPIVQGTLRVLLSGRPLEGATNSLGQEYIGILHPVQGYDNMGHHVDFIRGRNQDSSRATTLDSRASKQSFPAEKGNSWLTYSQSNPGTQQGTNQPTSHTGSQGIMQNDDNQVTDVVLGEHPSHPQGQMATSSGPPKKKPKNVGDQGPDPNPSQKQYTRADAVKHLDHASETRQTGEVRRSLERSSAAKAPVHAGDTDEVFSSIYTSPRSGEEERPANQLLREERSRSSAAEHGVTSAEPNICSSAAEHGVPFSVAEQSFRTSTVQSVSMGRELQTCLEEQLRQSGIHIEEFGAPVAAQKNMTEVARAGFPMSATEAIVTEVRPGEDGEVRTSAAATEGTGEKRRSYVGEERPSLRTISENTTPVGLLGIGLTLRPSQIPPLYPTVSAGTEIPMISHDSHYERSSHLSGHQERSSQPSGHDGASDHLNGHPDHGNYQHVVQNENERTSQAIGREYDMMRSVLEQDRALIASHEKQMKSHQSKMQRGVEATTREYDMMSQVLSQEKAIVDSHEKYLREHERQVREYEIKAKSIDEVLNSEYNMMSQLLLQEKAIMNSHSQHLRDQEEQAKESEQKANAMSSAKMQEYDLMTSALEQDRTVISSHEKLIQRHDQKERAIRGVMGEEDGTRELHSITQRAISDSQSITQQSLRGSPQNIRESPCNIRETPGRIHHTPLANIGESIPNFRASEDIPMGGKRVSESVHVQIGKVVYEVPVDHMNPVLAVDLPPGEQIASSENQLNVVNQFNPNVVSQLSPLANQVVSPAPSDLVSHFQDGRNQHKNDAKGFPLPLKNSGSSRISANELRKNSANSVVDGLERPASLRGFPAFNNTQIGASNVGTIGAGKRVSISSDTQAGVVADDGQDNGVHDGLIGYTTTAEFRSGESNRSYNIRQDPKSSGLVVDTEPRSGERSGHEDRGRVVEKDTTFVKSRGVMNADATNADAANNAYAAVVDANEDASSPADPEMGCPTLNPCLMGLIPDTASRTDGSRRDGSSRRIKDGNNSDRESSGDRKSSRNRKSDRKSREQRGEGGWMKIGYDHNEHDPHHDAFRAHLDSGTAPDAILGTTDTYLTVEDGQGRSRDRDQGRKRPRDGRSGDDQRRTPDRGPERAQNRGQGKDSNSGASSSTLSTDTMSTLRKAPPSADCDQVKESAVISNANPNAASPAKPRMSAELCLENWKKEKSESPSPLGKEVQAPPNKEASASKQQKQEPEIGGPDQQKHEEGKVASAKPKSASFDTQSLSLTDISDAQTPDGDDTLRRQGTAPEGPGGNAEEALEGRDEGVLGPGETETSLASHKSAPAALNDAASTAFRGTTFSSNRQTSEPVAKSNQMRTSSNQMHTSGHQTHGQQLLSASHTSEFRQAHIPSNHLGDAGRELNGLRGSPSGAPRGSIVSRTSLSPSVSSTSRHSEFVTPTFQQDSVPRPRACDLLQVVANRASKKMKSPSLKESRRLHGHKLEKMETARLRTSIAFQSAGKISKPTFDRMERNSSALGSNQISPRSADPPGSATPSSADTNQSPLCSKEMPGDRIKTHNHESAAMASNYSYSMTRSNSNLSTRQLSIAKPSVNRASWNSTASGNQDEIPGGKSNVPIGEVPVSMKSERSAAGSDINCFPDVNASEAAAEVHCPVGTGKYPPGFPDAKIGVPGLVKPKPRDPKRTSVRRTAKYRKNKGLKPPKGIDLNSICVGVTGEGLLFDRDNFDHGSYDQDDEGISTSEWIEARKKQKGLRELENLENLAEVENHRLLFETILAKRIARSRSTSPINSSPHGSRIGSRSGSRFSGSLDVEGKRAFLSPEEGIDQGGKSVHFPENGELSSIATQTASGIRSMMRSGSSIGRQAEKSKTQMQNTKTPNLQFGGFRNVGIRYTGSNTLRKFYISSTASAEVATHVPVRRKRTSGAQEYLRGVFENLPLMWSQFPPGIDNDATTVPENDERPSLPNNERSNLPDDVSIGSTPITAVPEASERSQVSVKALEATSKMLGAIGDTQKTMVPVQARGDSMTQISSGVGSMGIDSMVENFGSMIEVVKDGDAETNLQDANQNTDADGNQNDSQHEANQNTDGNPNDNQQNATQNKTDGLTDGTKKVSYLNKVERPNKRSEKDKHSINTHLKTVYTKRPHLGGGVDPHHSGRMFTQAMPEPVLMPELGVRGGRNGNSKTSQKHTGGARRTSRKFVNAATFRVRSLSAERQRGNELNIAPEASIEWVSTADVARKTTGNGRIQLVEGSRVHGNTLRRGCIRPACAYGTAVFDLSASRASEDSSTAFKSDLKSTYNNRSYSTGIEMNNGLHIKSRPQSVLEYDVVYVPKVSGDLAKESNKTAVFNGTKVSGDLTKESNKTAVVNDTNVVTNLNNDVDGNRNENSRKFLVHSIGNDILGNWNQIKNVSLNDHWKTNQPDYQGPSVDLNRNLNSGNLLNCNLNTGNSLLNCNFNSKGSNMSTYIDYNSLNVNNRNALGIGAKPTTVRRVGNRKQIKQVERSWFADVVDSG